MSNATLPVPMPSPEGPKVPAKPTSRQLRQRSIKQLRRWWSWRGGWHDFWRSPYTWTAALLMLPTAHYWLTAPWWETSLSILPNVIGFSLGGYAILLAFGDEGFRRLLVPAEDPSHPPDQPTRYMRVSAIFLHFILVQLWALMLAVVARSTDFVLPMRLRPSSIEPEAIDIVLAGGSCLLGFVGFFAFLYALGLAAAAALSVFGLSEAFEVYLKAQAEEERERQESRRK